MSDLRRLQETLRELDRTLKVMANIQMREVRALEKLSRVLEKRELAEELMNSKKVFNWKFWRK